MISNGWQLFVAGPDFNGHNQNVIISEIIWNWVLPWRVSFLRQMSTTGNCNFHNHPEWITSWSGTFFYPLPLLEIIIYGLIWKWQGPLNFKVMSTTGNCLNITASWSGSFFKVMFTTGYYHFCHDLEMTTYGSWSFFKVMSTTGNCHCRSILEMTTSGYGSTFKTISTTGNIHFCNDLEMTSSGSGFFSKLMSTNGICHFRNHSRSLVKMNLCKIIFSILIFNWY